MILSYVTGAREGPRTGTAGRQLDRHRPWLLARDMPRLDNHLHYRMIDVSSSRSCAAVGTPGSILDSRPRAGQRDEMVRR